MILLFLIRSHMRGGARRIVGRTLRISPGSFSRLSENVTGMPAWSKALSDQDIWKVTAFLSRIQKLPPGVQDYWKKSFGVGPLPAGSEKDEAKP